MERQYGPSSNRSKKEKLIHKLFGIDSDNETNEKNQNETITKAKQLQLENELFDSSDSEHGDVLQITVDNEYFVTPEKVNPNTPKALLITNTLARRHKFQTPNKQTHTAKELSNIVAAPHIALLSPIQKTPTRYVHTVVTSVSPTSNNSLSHSLVQSSIPQNQSLSVNDSNATHTHNRTHTSNETNAWSKKRFASAFTTRKRIPHNTHTNTNSQSQQRHTSTLTSSERTANSTQTHTRFQPYTFKRSSNIYNHCQTLAQQHTHASNTHTITQVQAVFSSSHTNTFTQNQTIPSSTPARIHAQSKNKQAISNSLISVLPQSRPKPTHTHTYSSATESITITIPNDVQPTTNKTKRQTDLGQNSNPSAPKTKILELNNKYVPKGVRLAIAVDKDKKLSKNALKKITRNLASQL